MNRHYIEITLKRPVETFRYDSLSAVAFMRVKRAIVFGLSDSKNRKVLDIVNWAPNRNLPGGTGSLEFSELRNNVESIEVVELPKTKMEQITYRNQPADAADADDEEDEEELKRNELTLVKKRLKLGKNSLQTMGFTRVLAKLPMSGRYGQRIPYPGKWVLVGEYNRDIAWDIWNEGGNYAEGDPNAWVLGHQTGYITYYYLVEADWNDESAAFEAMEEAWPELWEKYWADPDNEPEPEISIAVAVDDYVLARRTKKGDYEAIDGTIISSSDVK
jgi:hypothetical protein